MSKRTDKLMSRINAAPSEAVTPPDLAPPRRPILAQRDNALGKIAEGKQRTVSRIMHDPARIRMWSEHNRAYDLLSADRCDDLIQGFKRVGHQIFPAIVRPIEHDDFDYELICGARRHWTASYLKWDLLVEVKDLDDKQAFIWQDVENRNREDISDYERALDYQRALPNFFEGNRSAMAKFLEIDPSNFAKLLELAELPSVIVQAYGDMRELKVHHGTQYRRLIVDAASRRRVLDKAKSLKGEGLAGRQVFSQLKRAARASKATSSPRVTQVGRLSVQRQAAGTARVSLPALPSGSDKAAFKAALKKDFAAFVDEWISED